MKKLLYPALLTMGLFIFGATTQAQTTVEKSEPKNEHAEVKKEQEKPRHEVKTDPISEAGKNMEKAAESIQRSAEKIRVVVEDKADRIAKVSQPAIESFLLASSNLIEQIAKELEKMVTEKPAKKSSQ